MKKILEKPFIYSTVNTAVILFVAVLVSVASSQEIPMAEIDLRFIGPVAVFFLVVSLLFTYFPMVLVKSFVEKQFIHIKNISPMIALTEFVFFSMSFLGYISAMAGSNFGGVALIVISFFNILFLAAFSLILVLSKFWDKAQPKVIEWRTNQLHNKVQSVDGEIINR